MSNFKRGDKVVCMEGFSSLHGNIAVQAGCEYTVDNCTGVISLKEFPDFTFTPKRFKLVDTKHPYHDMIVEWAANPSRVVEICQGNTPWIKTSHPTWSENLQYRFADTVIPKRVFPTTSLSGAQLCQFYWDTKEGHMDTLVAVANAAIKQHILDSEIK